MPSLSQVEGWHAPAGRRTCETPASDPGQADQTGSAGGCQKNWDPADRSFRKTTRAASAESEVRPGPRLPTLRAHHVKIREAAPEALTHTLPADSVRPGVVPFARPDPRRSPRSGCWLISRSWRSPPLQSRGLAPTGFERPGLVEAAQATAASAPSCEVCLRGTMRWGHGDRLSRAARTALHRPVSLSSTAHTPGA